MRSALTKHALCFMQSRDMKFIDDPQFGHTKYRLPVLLVPVIMFAVLLLGIYASKAYVASVVENPPTHH